MEMQIIFGSIKISFSIFHGFIYEDYNQKTAVVEKKNK